MSGEATIWVRYDLRFFDSEEFLIDAFIPIGQPVVLNAGGKRRRVEGDFLIRTDDPRDFERLALMRLVARIMMARGVGQSSLAVPLLGV